MSRAVGEDPWHLARALTPARIGLGRAGHAIPTARLRELRAAHAAARDAVHAPFDLATVRTEVAALGLGDPPVVSSQASDRREYLLRPDLGRLPADLAALPVETADVGLVLADGLSPAAVNAHGAGLLRALVNELAPTYTIASPVIATLARVAIGDHVGRAMGVSTMIVVIGERPGLSASDGLGLYLTHGPRPGRSDAERNCISNVRPPQGLDYAGAARQVALLLAGVRRLGRSGVDLKVERGADAVQARAGTAFARSSAIGS